MLIKDLIFFLSEFYSLDKLPTQTRKCCCSWYLQKIILKLIFLMRVDDAFFCINLWCISAEITEDLSSGVVLATLLRVLSQENLKVNQNPKMRIHRMENVSVCLKFIETKGVKLVNISAEGMDLFYQVNCKFFNSKLS